MPDIDHMGTENATQGICGFTSTMYALYEKIPALQNHLIQALGNANRTFRLRAEIKTFLKMMQANNRLDILNAITNFTRGFPNYNGWSVDSYIAQINSVISEINDSNRIYSIAMPPVALMEYMHTMWEMSPVFVPGSTNQNNVILGLTDSSDTTPEPNKINPVRLKHYVYQGGNGKIYSWGKQFQNLKSLSNYANTCYSPIFYISF